MQSSDSETVAVADRGHPFGADAPIASGLPHAPAWGRAAGFIQLYLSLGYPPDHAHNNVAALAKRLHTADT